MTKKTKPIYLLIAGVLLLVVAIIFVLLLIQAYQTTASNTTSTRDIAPITYPNTIKDYESTKDFVSSTESNTEDTYNNVANVIHAKGIYVDKSGNVFDSNKIKYSIKDGYIAVVYEGQVYKISTKTIKELNPQKDDATNERKEEEKKEEQHPSNRSENTSPNTQNSSSTSNNQPQTSDKINVNQSTNITVPHPQSNTSQNNVKINYKSMTVKKNTVFNLILINAGSDVLWVTDNKVIEPVQAIGNQCSFRAVRTGTIQIKASYLKNDYFCLVTVI